MKESELAWAAGFFDGEGYVGFTKHSSLKQRTYMRLVMHIAQISREPLDRFQKAVGCGNVRGPYQPKKKNHKEVWVWSTSAYANVLAVGELLKPFLCSKKRKQFEAAIRASSDYRLGSAERRRKSGLLHRKDCCVRGHAYTKANTYVDKKDHRYCRACRSLYWKTYVKKERR